MDHHQSYLCKTLIRIPHLTSLICLFSILAHTALALEAPSKPLGVASPEPTTPPPSSTTSSTPDPQSAARSHSPPTDSSLLQVRRQPDNQPKDPLQSPVIHLGLGAPMLLSLGATLFPSHTLDLNLTASYLPIPVSKSGTLIILGSECALQWHPLGTRLFLLTGLGFLSFSYRTTLNLGKFSDTAGPERGTVSLSRLYAPLGFGIQWLSSQKLYLESDIGIQIPIFKSGGVNFESSSQAKTSLEEASRDVLQYYAGFILPRVTFIRFGIRI